MEIPVPKKMVFILKDIESLDSWFPWGNFFKNHSHIDGEEI